MIPSQMMSMTIEVHNQEHARAPTAIHSKSEFMLAVIGSAGAGI
jgi:hypothetical protein